MDPMDFGKACDGVNDKIIGNPYFDILNFLELNEDGFQEDFMPSEYVPGRSPTSDNQIVSTISKNCNIKHENGVKKKKMKMEGRIAFITKSEVETMDDGFKWRKYGKKMVKNSPNPRNYYKCSNGGCGVKKRVERDNEDSRYVRTTYDGVHNHESPCVLYDHHHHNDVNTHAWTLQPSNSSSTSQT